MTMADGSGSWNYSIQCTNSTFCGTGTSNMVPGPINFDLTLASGISPASFVQNGKSLYFASDIGTFPRVAATTPPGTLVR